MCRAAIISFLVTSSLPSWQILGLNVDEELPKLSECSPGARTRGATGDVFGKPACDNVHRKKKLPGKDWSARPPFLSLRAPLPQSPSTTRSLHHLLTRVRAAAVMGYLNNPTMGKKRIKDAPLCGNTHPPAAGPNPTRERASLFCR